MKKYFHSDGKEKHGPISFDQLRQENIGKDTLIWFEGLNDWTPASELEEMRPILELRPPPITATEDHSAPEKDPEANFEARVRHKPDQVGLKKASQGWIVLGFIFSVLGGWLGIAMGFNYAFGNYDKETKSIGWLMAILGVLCIVIYRSL